MPFKNSLILESIRGTAYYKVAAPLVYETREGLVIQVPVGFCTDLATVPWLFKGMVEVDEGYLRDAAVIHDYLYSKGELPRCLCDRIFLEAMLSLGMPKGTGNMIYWVVRLFGSKYYGKE